MGKSISSYRAALDAGSAFCYKSDVIGPAQVSRALGFDFSRMNFILPIVFASVAAIGNALFAYGQRQAVGVANGLLYVSASALLAGLLALLASPATGSMQLGMLGHNWRLVCVSGLGLFLTYLGFNLLYSRFGVAPYVLYAVVSVITTTVIVGYIVLREHINGYHIAAIIAALVTVVLFSLGQKSA